MVWPLASVREMGSWVAP